MKRLLSVLIMAILAGFAIGLGGSVFLAMLPISKVLGAFLFTVGLFTVCTLNLNLFTGKACYMFDNKPSYLFDLLIIWIGNLIGAWLIAFLIISTRLAPAFTEAAKGLVTTKNNDSLLSLFVLGMICNVLIYIAVENFRNNSNDFAKVLALIFGVMVFILMGTEHSIADMYYYAVAGELFTANGLIRIVIITLGNVTGGLIFPLSKKTAEKLTKRI
ncbi:MAG: formate/nitrite transporter family protein [Ruminococcaceae bacterium]|nr:formate/nitrite transporter family protein [Oscillospiraceae bacterium]